MLGHHFFQGLMQLFLQLFLSANSVPGTPILMIPWVYHCWFPRVVRLMAMNRGLFWHQVSGRFGSGLGAQVLPGLCCKKKKDGLGNLGWVQYFGSVVKTC
jgi:hypothetical protein